MKLFTCLLTLGILTSTNLFAQGDIDDTEDEKQSEIAVIKWADSVFYSHSEYKFEHFKAFYTDEYTIAIARRDFYKQRVDDLETDKKSGKYKKSDEEYTNEHKELEEAYLKIKDQADNFKLRVTHFQIHFWSNIQTTDGITVYYEHIVKLDNDYRVTDATINSAIGKKDENTKILYKVDVKGGKKKVDKALDPVKDNSIKTTGEPPKDGGVTITTDNPVVQNNPKVEPKQLTKKELKAKAKAEKKAEKARKKAAKKK